MSIIPKDLLEYVQFMVDTADADRLECAERRGRRDKMAHIYRALDVANYFLFKGQKDEDLISNLKLQKLVYYAQGIHLALYGKPLFKEHIKAWNYGPVIPELYFRYNKHEANGISPDQGFKETQIDKETRVFLDEIYTVFGQFSAKRLIDFTHNDQCWKDARPNGIITHKAMQNCLKKYLRHGKK
jgi:uncharacterized phage-associated protein